MFLLQYDMSLTLPNFTLPLTIHLAPHTPRYDGNFPILKRKVCSSKSHGSAISICQEWPPEIELLLAPINSLVRK